MFRTGVVFLIGMGIGALALMLWRAETELAQPEVELGDELTAGATNRTIPASETNGAPASNSHDALLRQIAELENQVADLQRSRGSDGAVSGGRGLPTAPDASSFAVPEQVRQAQEAHFLELAAATGRSADDMRQLTEQSYALRGEFDLHEIFASEERDPSGGMAWLESVVSNQAWAVAGTPYPPASLETECRSSGCRVALTYSTGEATIAVFRSTVDIRLLADLETYGFEAAEAVIPLERSESEPSGPGFEIFLWRRPESP